MRKKLFLYLVGAALFMPLRAQQNDSIIIRQIFDEVLTNGKCYEWLDYLANQIGGRLSGSPEAAAAVEYTRQVMLEEGFDSVWLQPVMVPHWVRGGREQGRIVHSSAIGEEDLSVCALGNSVGTPPGGITAPVVEVHNWEELKSLGRKGVEGKIVFFNTPMEPRYVTTFRAYGEAVQYRWAGAREAGKLGAVAVLVRSMTLAHDDNPHTGSMGYGDDPDIPKIPALAVSTNDADRLSRLLENDPGLQLYLWTNCHFLPEVLSYNVVGEIRGSEHPDEIITVGGHLDSWDTGDGAHDDGAGCVQSIEVLRIFKQLGIRPKRTIRAVMFMNEENGGRGGRKYAEIARQNPQEKHLAALESDAGGFAPRGFGVKTEDDRVLQKIAAWQPLLQPYEVDYIVSGYGGADIRHLEELGTVLIGLRPESQRYFDYHHAPIDTFDKVNKRELELGAGAMAALIYLISEYGL